MARTGLGLGVSGGFLAPPRDRVRRCRACSERGCGEGAQGLGSGKFGLLGCNTATNPKPCSCLLRENQGLRAPEACGSGKAGERSAEGCPVQGGRDGGEGPFLGLRRRKTPQSLYYGSLYHGLNPTAVPMFICGQTWQWHRPLTPDYCGQMARAGAIAQALTVWDLEAQV